MSEFSNFLNDSHRLEVDGLPLFCPGYYDETAATAWLAWPEPRPSTAADLDDAESRLKRKLPAGYRAFLQTVGPGSWAEAFICAPEVLYEFDQETLDMQGFIPLACNVDGCGNYIAYRESPEESIVFCSHDPFGYAVVAGSFEEYIENLTRYTVTTAKAKPKDFYSKLDGFVYIAEPKRKKQWWQFWM